MSRLIAGTEHALDANQPSDILPRIDYDLIKAHGYAAVITLFLSALAGLLVALKLTMPDLLSSHAALTWGRLRFDHTQGIFFWLACQCFLCVLLPHGPAPG